MHRRPSIGQRLRYAFDTTMSRGISALIGYLGLASLVLVAIFSAVVLLGGFAPKSGGGDRPGVLRQLFNSLLHAIDPGTVANDDGKWPFLVAMLLLTLSGLFIVSALIGVLATALDSRLEELRKGRSFVVEKDHTLILGWSETVFTILSELAIANESEKNPVVVILARQDKVEMEDAIRSKVRHLGKTRVVCRTGSPIDMHDLGIVNPRECRSVIVLAPDDEPDPDAQVIKVVLALTEGPHRREDPYRIVAEIQEPSNMEAARLVAGTEATLVDKSETIARLLVQSSRQSGISVVYTELLDSSGDEVYFRHDPALEGRTFGEALLAYEECAVIGLAQNGTVRLNPPAGTRIAEGERVIAIAGDDSVLDVAPVIPEPPIEESAIVDAGRQRPASQRMLLIGWNGRAPLVIREMDGFSAPGSELLVVASLPEAGDVVQRLGGELRNLSVSFEHANTTDRRTLDALDAASFDSVVVLCYSDELEPQQADARTLVTLLQLRDIATKRGEDFTIVSEMVDDRNRELAEVTEVNDVIVSDRVISLILAQLSESDDLQGVFGELFQAEGSEVYLRPAAEYVRPGEAVSFATVIEAALRRGETAIGFRVQASCRDAEADYGVRVNPPKSEEIGFAEGDKVIVLAED